MNGNCKRAPGPCECQFTKYPLNFNDFTKKTPKLWQNQKDPLNFNKINMHPIDSNFTEKTLNFAETNLHSTNFKFTENPCIQAQH